MYLPSVTVTGAYKLEKEISDTRDMFYRAKWTVFSHPTATHQLVDEGKCDARVLSDVYSARIDLSAMLYVVNKEGRLDAATVFAIDYARKRNVPITYSDCDPFKRLDWVFIKYEEDKHQFKAGLFMPEADTPCLVRTMDETVGIVKMKYGDTHYFSFNPSLIDEKDVVEWYPLIDIDD